MIINVRTLEEKINSGLLEGRALENAKSTLDKIEHRVTRLDKWVLENNEGTYGTEVVITKEGHIDFYLCIMEKYASRISYIRVGNFQPEFSVGDVQLVNGKEKEYQKLGNIINALNKEYEKYEFYFTADTKNNRRILKESRKNYELYKNPVEEVEVAPEHAQEPEKKSDVEIINEDYDNVWSCILEKSLKKVACKKQLGLVGTLTIVDVDADRLTFENEEGEEFAIRMWSAYNTHNGKKVKVEWTLFHHPKTSGSGVNCGRGTTTVTLSEVPENLPEKNARIEKRNEQSKLGLKLLETTKEEVADMLESIGEHREYAENEQFVAGFHLQCSSQYYAKGFCDTCNTVQEVWDGIKEDMKIYVVDKVKKMGIEITTEKHTEKMEEKEMKALNKNSLNNRMVKLGEFLKENKDVDAIEKKVYELFPNAMELQIFDEDDDAVYFLVGQDYAGKAPTKKEMKAIDYQFDRIHKVYGLSVHVEIQEEKIKMSANVGVDYITKYDHSEFTDYTIKEMEIELELTMEMAQEIVSSTRKQHDEGKINATRAWERIKELTKRETTEEVKDFLIGELPYYAYKEQEEKEIENRNEIEVGICKIDLQVQKGILWREKAEEKIERLYKYASTPELQELVDLAIKYIAVRKEDNIRVPKKLQEILDRRYKKVVDGAVEKIEEKITGQETPEQVQTILSGAFKNISIINNGQLGYNIESKIIECYRGEVNEVPADATQILRGGEVYIGVEYIKATNETIVYVRTKIEYLDTEGEFKTYIDYLYYKEIKINPDPEKDKLDELIEEYNEVASEIDALQLNQSVGEDCSKAIANKHEKLMKLQQKIKATGDVIVVKYSHRCFVNVPDGVKLFRTQEEVDKFEKETESILEIQKVFTSEKKELCLDSQEESGNAPEPEESDLEKMIKEHINEVLDLSLKGDCNKRYKYEKTVAVKKQGGYQLTSMFMDTLTDMKVYIGHSGNMILTPNSEKKYVDDSIRGLLSDRKSINETINEIKEKIKRKFEYSYSKSISVIEPDETKVYVLVSAENAEVFWNYEDAYKHMLASVREMEERFSFNYKPVIEKNSAKLDNIKWTIMEKTVL